MTAADHVSHLLTACSPAWSGFCSAADRALLDAVLRRCRRLGYLDDTDAVSVDELFQSADDKLFEKIVLNSAHVLQPLIPDRPPSSYDLRPSDVGPITNFYLIKLHISMISNLSFVCSTETAIDQCTGWAKRSEPQMLYT